MLVRDAKPDQIIETVFEGQPTGNLYRITRNSPRFSRVQTVRRFQSDFTYIHPDNNCRVITQYPKQHPLHIDGF